MKPIQKTLLTLAVSALLAVPALAGSDLVLTYGANNSAKLTSNLAQPIYLTGFQHSNGYINLALQLAAGQTLPLQLSGSRPTSLWGRALSANGKPLAGHTPDADGGYELSVLIQ